jgi:hypothetical protein
MHLLLLLHNFLLLGLKLLLPGAASTYVQRRGPGLWLAVAASVEMCIV